MCLSRNLIIYWQCSIQGCGEVVVEMCGTLKLCYRILDGQSIPVQVPNDARCPRRFPLDINDDGVRDYSLGNDPCSQHTDDEVAEFQRLQQLENDAAWQIDELVNWELEGDRFDWEMEVHPSPTPQTTFAQENLELQLQCAPEPMAQRSLSPQQWNTYHATEEFTGPVSAEEYREYPP